MPSLVEIGPVVQEKKIFKFCQCIFAFFSYHPLENGGTVYLKNLNSLHFNQEFFVPSLVEIGPVVQEKKIFKISQCIFAFFYYHPLENGWTIHLNSLHFPQECFVPSLVEIGPVVLEKRTFNFVNVFLIFRNYLPLEKSGPLFEVT